MATAPPIEVILKSSDGQDTFHERRITLTPGLKIPIGRASKNAAKPELMMAPGNAFIDSPVISREHAILSTDPAPPKPSVYIMDNGSMHGTIVNGSKLSPNRVTKLSNGDLLQFGADVSRNDSFYTARKYVFESSLPDGFPNGFSVPESETSEEEDEDVDVDIMNDMDDLMMTQPPGYGTQTNPVNVDDFEDAQPAAAREIFKIDSDEEDLGEEDVTMMRAELTATSEETEDRMSSPPTSDSVAQLPAVEPERRDQVSNDYNNVAPVPFHTALCGSSDDGAAQSTYSSDYDADSLRCVSEVSDVDQEGNSEGEPASDMDASDDNAEDDDDEEDDDVEQEDVDTVRRMTMQAMLNHTSVDSKEHDATPNSPFAPRPSAPIGVPQLIASSTAPSPRRDDPYPTFAASAQPPTTAALREPESAVPPMDPFMQPLGMFDEAYGNHLFSGHMDSSLPPRPAAPKPVSWSTPLYSSPYAPRDSSTLRMYPEELPAFMAPHAEFSSDMFENYNGAPAIEAFNKFAAHNVMPENPWAPSKPSKTDEALTSTIGEASGVQTPPQAASSEVSSPPQPRRTKVSIPEIVDSPQQPPTPTSVTGGSLKRKAEVLEEDTADLASEPSSTPAPVPVGASATVLATPPASQLSERPMKKLRSRLGNVAKITFGAAVAVALMSQVPDAFFEA